MIRRKHQPLGPFFFLKQVLKNTTSNSFPRITRAQLYGLTDEEITVVEGTA